MTRPDYETHVAAHPHVLSMTDAECAVEAALAQGWYPSYGNRPSWWVIPGGLRQWPNIRDYRPCTDFAQAAELRAFTARETGCWATTRVLPDGSCAASVVHPRGPAGVFALVESRPTESDASTRACLLALRKHRGLA